MQSQFLFRFQLFHQISLILSQIFVCYPPQAIVDYADEELSLVYSVVHILKAFTTSTIVDAHPEH